jgi:hypothetical protein
LLNTKLIIYEQQQQQQEDISSFIERHSNFKLHLATCSVLSFPFSVQSAFFAASDFLIDDDHNIINGER